MKKNKFGNWLRKERTKKGFSATEFAQACNLSKVIVSRYENGKDKPSIKTIRVIAKVLDVEVETVVAKIL